MTAARRGVDLVRAGWWALRATRAVGGQLARHALAPVVVPPMPGSAAGRGLRGVQAVLRWRRARCLERATVLQAWYLARGLPRDVVIGVRRAEAAFEAHAWLDGDPGSEGYVELVRRPPTALVMTPRLRGSRRSRRRRSEAPSRSPYGAA